MTGTSGLGCAFSWDWGWEVGGRKACPPAGGHGALRWFRVLSGPAAAVRLDVAWMFLRRDLELSSLTGSFRRADPLTGSPTAARVCAALADSCVGRLRSGPAPGGTPGLGNGVLLAPSCCRPREGDF